MGLDIYLGERRSWRDLFRRKQNQSRDAICKLVEEHERQMLSVIDERDEAQEAVSHIYYLVFGHSAEWSNNYGMQDAIRDISDAVNVLKKAATASGY